MIAHGCLADFSYSFFKGQGKLPKSRNINSKPTRLVVAATNSSSDNGKLKPHTYTSTEENQTGYLSLTSGQLSRERLLFDKNEGSHQREVLEEAERKKRSALGDLGEDPYRTLKGKKIYLDELDVIGFLEGFERLTPLDPSTYNAAAYLWTKIGNIPESRRHRLLQLLTPEHILRLWRVAGLRFQQEEMFVQDANDMLPDGRLDDPLKPQFWDGRVIGLSGPLRLFSNFQKAFFVGKDGNTYGRVIAGGDFFPDIGKNVAPSYFEVKKTYSLRVNDKERCDTAFVYSSGVLQESTVGWPSGFPSPKLHLWPLSDGMKDYIRAAGPGVLVGQAWQDGLEIDSGPRKFLGEFLLVKKFDSNNTEVA